MSIKAGVAGHTQPCSLCHPSILGHPGITLRIAQQRTPLFAACANYWQKYLQTPVWRRGCWRGWHWVLIGPQAGRGASLFERFPHLILAHKPAEGACHQPEAEHPGPCSRELAHLFKYRVLFLIQCQWNQLAAFQPPLSLSSHLPTQGREISLKSQRVPTHRKCVHIKRAGNWFAG